MKISRLLVLTALWLGITGSAKAANLTGTWEMPEPQGLTFVDNIDVYEHYILYNPATKMFFASGNGWNTMASLRTFGMEIWLDDATEADAPEGSYRLCDNNVNNPARSTGEGDMFTDDGDATWVDHASQANYSWIYENENGYVRLQNAAFVADHPDYEGKYLGFDGTYIVAANSAGDGNHRDAYTAILKHVDPSAEGVCVDWKAVTVESYEAFVLSDDYQTYQDGAKTFLASKGLKVAIENAEALWISTASAEAVYNNPESTAAQMESATAALNELIEAKTKLKAAIEDAEAKGFQDTAAFRAILTKTDATKAEVEQAITDLNNAFVEWAKNNASLDNPSDLSSKIVNATFDNGNCTTGWSGDAFGRGGTVADGAEHYNKNYNTYQKITGLAPGVYAVGVNGFYRAGNYGGDAERHFLNGDAKYARFYATVGERNFETAIVSVLSGAQTEQQGVGDVEITYTDPVTEEEVVVYAPNTMAAGDYYFHTLNQYANKLYVLVDETGELTIGVKKTSQIGNDWSLFDDFSLTFYGQAADACQFYLNEAMKNYGEYNIEAGVLYTESYLTAYQQACTGEKTASSIAEINAVLDVIDAAKAALDKNIQLWKDYQALIVKAQGMLTDPTYQRVDELGDLGDYIDFEYEDIIKEVALTNEELEAEITKIQDLMTLIDDKSKTLLQDGDDVTYLIKNPTFESSTTENTGNSDGWTVDRISGGNVTPGPIGGDGNTFIEKCGYYNACFESWHCHKWDVWQEITGLPVGMYELEVQGYVRCEVSGYNRGDDLVAPYTSPVYLYMNNAMSQFPSVYSESPADAGVEFQIVESWTIETINDIDYPNSMGGAAQCFHIDEAAGLTGMYKTRAYGLIAKEGDSFRIGVKMDADQDWWCIWDNFKLTYRNPSAELVKPILEEALNGLNLDQPMGKDIYEKAVAVKAEAQTALASNDGNKMFTALTKVYDLSADIIASVALFEQLVAANEGLMEHLNSEAAVNTQAIAEARALNATIESGVENHTITDAEAKEYMEKIDVLYTKVVLPNNINEASDNNPVDVTAAIKSPSFEDEWGMNSSTGWTNPGNLGNDDTQKSALAIEFWQSAFNMYQTIKGLPEGTYMLQADAWCRNGGNDENYAEWQTNPEATMAMIYGMAGDSTIYSSFVANIMKAGDVLLESTGLDGEAEFTVGETTYWLPGSLVSGKGIIELNPGVYTNTAIVKVNADEILTIGIKKGEEKTNSWVVCDDFKLFYLGKNSSKTPDSDLTGIEDVNAKNQIAVEYFTVDGRKATRAQKGIVIKKMTLENGATLVQKIRK